MPRWNGPLNVCRPLLHRGENLGDPTGQVLLRHPATGKWRSGESEGWLEVWVFWEGPGSETGNLGHGEVGAMLWDVWEVQTYWKIYENVRLLVRSAHCDWQVDAKSCFSDEWEPKKLSTVSLKVLGESREQEFNSGPNRSGECTLCVCVSVYVWVCVCEMFQDVMVFTIL